MTGEILFFVGLVLGMLLGYFVLKLLDELGITDFGIG
jgi:hypothetical protein